MRDAVIQMFDWRFDHIARAIPDVRALGYADIHVSPPQQSNEAAWQWWGRYQPIGYGIGGPLGTADAFSAMAAVARAQGMRIIADVVMQNPCGPPDMLCGVPLADRAAAFRAGLEYLRRLVRLGADGFRFDAAGAIPPEFLRWALPTLGTVAAFGEIVSHRVGDLHPYLDVSGLRMLDFPLLSTLREALAPGGDLRVLRDPAAFGRALDPARAVGFVRNHDIERGQANDKGIDETAYRTRFGVGWDEASGRLDRTSVDLAHAYLFAREGGTPYVLAAMRTEAVRTDRHDDPVIAAGLAFRARCANHGHPGEIWRISGRATIGWQRGDELFAVINRADVPFDATGAFTSLCPGCYHDLRGGASLHVTQQGRVGHGIVARRSAALYVRAA